MSDALRRDAESYAEDPPPGVVFPRQHSPERLRAEMQALLIGELVEEEGCLQAGDSPAAWIRPLVAPVSEQVRVILDDGELWIRRRPLASAQKAIFEQFLESVYIYSHHMVQ